MTGRSTGTEESVPKFRHSCFNMESLTTELDKQTNEVQDIMRHSIATNYSFHSKVSVYFIKKVFVDNSCYTLFFAGCTVLYFDCACIVIGFALCVSNFRFTKPLNQTLLISPLFASSRLGRPLYYL